MNRVYSLCCMIAQSEGWTELDADSLEAFMAAAAAGLIFVRGPCSIETENIAVVLRALEHDLHGILHVAVIDRASEQVARRRLGLRRFPGVVWVGAGRILARQDRMRRWTDYAGATEAALADLRRILEPQRK